MAMDLFDKDGALTRTVFVGENGTWNLYRTYKKGMVFWDEWVNKKTGEVIDCKRSIIEKMYKEKKIK